MSSLTPTVWIDYLGGVEPEGNGVLDHALILANG